ncbi:MAG: AEC family transporter [Prevotella sp.]|nr:AEC family transporter [Prevotella sp.]MBR1839040.1 AEC family transporter [Prevotella sp.]
MENLTVMISLVTIVVIGFVAGKVGYMNEEFDKKLSALIVNITCPALILSSTMGDTLPDRDMIVPLLVISFITYTLLTLLSFTLPPLLTRRKEDEGVTGFALMFGNVGFIGYPIVASIFGYEAVFYAAILNVANTFFVFTVGDMLIRNGNETSVISTNVERFHDCARNDKLGARNDISKIVSLKRFEKKVLYSTPMLAAYLSMLIVALGITGIPEEVSKPLTMIGGITVPGALLIIGSTMAQLSGRAMLGNMTVYATSVCRLVLIPFVFYWLFTWMGFSEYVVNINTVIIAMPVATYGTILCLINNRDTTLMTELTFTTTVLSMLTIPLLSAVLGG